MGKKFPEDAERNGIVKDWTSEVSSSEPDSIIVTGGGPAIADTTGIDEGDARRGATEGTPGEGFICDKIAGSCKKE